MHIKQPWFLAILFIRPLSSGPLGARSVQHVSRLLTRLFTSHHQFSQSASPNLMPTWWLSPTITASGTVVSAVLCFMGIILFYITGFLFGELFWTSWLYWPWWTRILKSQAFPKFDNISSPKINLRGELYYERLNEPHTVGSWYDVREASTSLGCSPDAAPHVHKHDSLWL